MADPTRKRHLGSETKNTPTNAGSPPDPPYVVRIATPQHLASISFEDLATGRGSDYTSTGHANFKGGYRGRPSLALQFVEQLRVDVRRGATASVANGNAHTALRALWRFLDACHAINPVEDIDDINDIHGALWFRDDPNPNHYKVCRRLIVAGRSPHLPPLHWPTAPSYPKRCDLPRPDDIRAIYHQLKSDVRAVVNRWNALPVTLATGKDLRKAQIARDQWTKADLATTFREVTKALGVPVDSAKALATHAGDRVLSENGLLLFRDLVGSFYPLKEDVQKFYWLFLLQTGWNPTVALDIDISKGDWHQPHPFLENLVSLRSIKLRGGPTGQHTFCSTRQDTSPFRLIQKLLEVTEPLRHAARDLLQRLQTELQTVPKDSPERADCHLLEQIVRSPWVFCMADGPLTLGCLTRDNYQYGQLRLGYSRKGEPKDTQYAWPCFLYELNTKAAESVDRARKAGHVCRVASQVAHNIRLSDFRDGFISFAYAHSGYSWLVAKVAAGHRSLDTLKHYFRQRHHRERGEEQVRKLQANMWHDIRHHAVVDPALLRAMVDRGHISSEQRRRWLDHKDRTRVGMGCLDFSHPDPKIAPHHKEGTGCRVQRCTLCKQGIVFSDSISFLARRKAELTTLQSMVPVTTWLESSFGDELDTLTATLAQFDSSLVDAKYAHWMDEIRAGRHRIIDQEGAYEQ